MTLVWIGFAVFILAMLALDLYRKEGVVAWREALAWSCVWVALALLFALGIGLFWDRFQEEPTHEGLAKAVEFLTGYAVELSLSIDNLFVFLVIFQYFGVPEHHRHRALVAGIVFAIVLRIAFILVGATLLHYFHWVIYLFGLILIYTAYKLLYSAEEEVDPEKNWVLRIVRKFIPVATNVESPHFWVRREGRWHATSLALVLAVVGSTDIVFAFDSIPAVFGVTRDPFVVLTSNVFAVLGLRSFYFLIAGKLAELRYLKPALALVLGFIGLKMIVEELLGDQLEAWGIGQWTRTFVSLGVVVGILGVAVVASWLPGPEKPNEAESGDKAADAITENPKPE